MYYIISYYIILLCIILYCIILYYIVLYHIISYYIIYYILNSYINSIYICIYLFIYTGCIYDMMICDIWYTVYGYIHHPKSQDLKSMEWHPRVSAGLKQCESMCIPTWLSEEPLSFNFFGQMRVGKVRRPRLQTTHQMPLSRSWNGWPAHCKCGLKCLNMSKHV